MLVALIYLARGAVNLAVGAEDFFDVDTGVRAANRATGELMIGI